MERFKRLAAKRAVDEYVNSGMLVGLGSGSTAGWVVREIGSRIERGELERVRGVATSQETERLAIECGIPMVELGEEQPAVTLDGADEVGPGLTLIKGLGGALLREKIVASASAQLVIVADASKLVSSLGEKSPLPVELVRFGWKVTLRSLACLGCAPKLRTRGSQPFVTDGGNYIADCDLDVVSAPERIETCRRATSYVAKENFSNIFAPERLEVEMKRIPGVVETGIFHGMADFAVLAGSEGVRILRAPDCD